MIGFHGEYEVTVDSKGRFLLPSALKKQLPEGETCFVIARGFENSITLYPMQTWDKVIEKFSKLNQFDPKVRQFTRQFLGGATQVELDTAGRLLLSATFKDYAGIDKDAVIAASLDKFEIWNATKYKQLFENISSDDFSNLAKDVMTGL
ncbi:MAG: division/cell wall cluster transcriptional repressor MraZ [Chitinophagaceae bacterium]